MGPVAAQTVVLAALARWWQTLEKAKNRSSKIVIRVDPGAICGRAATRFEFERNLFVCVWVFTLSQTKHAIFVQARNKRPNSRNKA